MGMGQNFNTYYPYTPMPFYGMYSPVSSGKSESAEDIKKTEKKKSAEEFLKKFNAIREQTEKGSILEEQIKKIEDSKKELENVIDKANSGRKNSDGTIAVKETWDDYKKLPWWKKGLRGASHLVQGTWKLATGFVGYETDPKTGESKWNWKKGLKNAAIAAGCIALTAIPVVGPVISTTLLTTGVVCGAIGTAKGVSKAINAKTPEELDNAFQDMGSGLTIGISSAVGLRGLGKGLQASAASSGSSSAVRASGNNAVSQFVKDATVNAYRATVQGIKTDKAAVAANGFAKTFGTNLKGFVPKLGKSKFENARYDTTQKINTRLNEITQELNNPSTSAIKKALLRQEETLLNAQKTELSGTITKEAWKNLKTNSMANNSSSTLKNAITELKTNGSVNINGTTYNMSNENLSALQEALSRSQRLSKDIQNLIKIRTSTIKKMSLMKKYKSEVEAYTGQARNNRISRLYDTAKISKSDITWKKALLSPLKLLWEATMIPFKPWNYVQNSATSTFYKIEETFVPTYEAGFLTTGFMAEVMGMGERALTTKIITKDENGNDVEQIVPVTNENLAQLQEQLNQYNDAVANAQKEYNQLFTA